MEITSRILAMTFRSFSVQLTFERVSDFYLGYMLMRWGTWDSQCVLSAPAFLSQHATPHNDTMGKQAGCWRSPLKMPVPENSDVWLDSDIPGLPKTLLVLFNLKKPFKLAMGHRLGPDHSLGRHAASPFYVLAS